MTKQNQKNTKEHNVQEIIRYEYVICTLAADLLMMNKMLEEGKTKSPQQAKPSFFQSVIQWFRTKKK